MQPTQRQLTCRAVVLGLWAFRACLAACSRSSLTRVSPPRSAAAGAGPLPGGFCVLAERRAWGLPAGALRRSRHAGRGGGGAGRGGDAAAACEAALRALCGHQQWRREDARPSALLPGSTSCTSPELHCDRHTCALLHVSKLKQLAKINAQLSPASFSGAFDWREAEAALYCIRSVAKVAPPPTSQLLGTLR